MEWKIETTRSDGQKEIFYSNFTLNGIKSVINHVGNTVVKIFTVKDGIETEYVEPTPELVKPRKRWWSWLC